MGEPPLQLRVASTAWYNWEKVLSLRFLSWEVGRKRERDYKFLAFLGASKGLVCGTAHWSLGGLEQQRTMECSSGFGAATVTALLDQEMRLALRFIPKLGKRQME